MHLRVNPFFPTLFVSLLFIASTFTIPISPDSDSHDQSRKLGDCDVLPQSIHARADAPPPPYGTPPYPNKPLEAHVLFQGNPLSEEDWTALKSAIERMLKPAVSAFKKEAQRGLLQKLPNWNANSFPKVKEIPVTDFSYQSSLEVDSTSDTDYRFQFTFAGKLNVLRDGQASSEGDAGWGAFFMRGYPFHGTIARASLSNGGKLTGRIWALNRQTSRQDELVSFKEGKAKTSSSISNILSNLNGKLNLTW
ncbi:hypothetical protein DFH05DRAFT_1524189 [Lentinula detonsa]|uniref:Uncharacterized protein n=1 Tax=Lentinula detonsa TaxID=2804962 RepID=A0A9W8P3G0_9AGAR|nr:hypothetical protein DFH05DRAFT_1524189 [Lentinula detonsa]